MPRCTMRRCGKDSWSLVRQQPSVADAPTNWRAPMRLHTTSLNRSLRSTTRARCAAGLALAGAAMLLGALALPSTAQATNGQGHGNQWGPAESVDAGGLLGINTAAGEGCPSETPDAHMLFFASNRAGG